MFLREIEHKTGAQLFVMAMYENAHGILSTATYEIVKHIIDYC